MLSKMCVDYVHLLVVAHKYKILKHSLSNLLMEVSCACVRHRAGVTRQCLNMNC